MPATPDYAPGHLMHPLQGRSLATTPWGWRPAVVTAVDAHTVTAAYLHDDTVVECWHHRALAGEVAPGEPVRVHEQHHGLEVGDTWINVRIDAGAGPAPRPERPELWAAEIPGVLVNQATGQGMRISPEVARRLRGDA
jgi:hypothetical protein